MIIYSLAALAGWILGMLANRFIYDWAFFPQRSLSPWGSRPAVYSIQPIHRIPIVGWFFVGNLAGQTLYPREWDRASEEERKWIPQLGRFSWLRPLAVELLCLTAVPLLIFWYRQGGLVGGPENLNLLPGGESTFWVQVVLHTVALWLMLIAALIDWDERTIPDQTTVTGLVIGLITLTLWPDARLPIPVFDGLTTKQLLPLHVLSPDNFLPWFYQAQGLLLAIACWTFWAVLVIPKLIDWRYGFGRTLKYAWASVIRPNRRSANAIQPKRVIAKTTWVTLAVWLGGMALMVWAWQQQGSTWESCFSQIVSLGLAGLGVWLVRVLASMTIGDEALGFGDVTLMFMIGAIFGWHLALVCFVLGPILSLGFAVGNMLLTGEQRLAFGPWLCAGAAIGLLAWSQVWDYSQGFFGIGVVTLLGIIGFCLALLPPLLWILIVFKKLAGLDRN